MSRGDGGYVLCPAEHPSQRPPLLLERRQRGPHRGRARLAAGQAKWCRPSAPTLSPEWRTLIEGVGEGARNCSLAKLAGHLLRHHVNAFVTLGLLQAWNATNCKLAATTAATTAAAASAAAMAATTTTAPAR